MQTVNVWTHLLGFILFGGILIYTLFFLSPVHGFNRIAVPHANISTDSVPEAHQHFFFSPIIFELENALSKLSVLKSDLIAWVRCHNRSRPLVSSSFRVFSLPV